MRIQWQSRRFFPDLYGGLEVRSYNLVKSWLALGEQVSVLTEDYPSGRRRRQDEPLPNLSVVRIPSPLPGFLWRIAPLARTLRWAWHQRTDFSPEIVVAAYPECAISSKLRFPRRPVLFNCVCATVEHLPPRERLLTSVLIRTAARLSDRIVLASLNTKRQLTALSPSLPEEKISVVPHAADVDRFSTARPRPDLLPLRAGGKNTLILYAGRLSPEKGVDLAIEAFARMRNSVQAHLLLLGSGPSEPALRRQVQQAGLTRRVHFLGQTEHPEECFAAADLLVLPSRIEAFGTVLVEAMSAGIPCASWHSSPEAPVASEEIIEEGRTGLLAKPFDTAELARCLDTLVADTSLRQKMGRAGQARTRSLYTLEAMARKYLDLAEGLVPGHAAGRRMACPSPASEAPG